MSEINHPPHYNQGDIECIDAIEAALGPEDFQAYLRGNIIKYAWRLKHKDTPYSNAMKAEWYASKLAASGPADRGETRQTT